MKIITQEKIEKKEKGGGVTMKRLMIAVVLAGMVLVLSNNAFAYWKVPVKVEIRDPAVISAVAAEISLR
ncbi:MAG: hypothetical protein NG740_03065 [Omnitrophica bacterium]|nr:hypothetical protein [Candidatus Omnitrophota bacterium]